MEPIAPIQFYHAIIVLFFMSTSVLAFLLIDKTDKVAKIASSLHRIKLAFDKLDEQAKLIVRTDLELNKSQEELDKRLAGLDALQKTSRLISTTLDENEIYQCLDHPTLTELGFEKYLILTPHPEQGFQCRIAFGYSMGDTHGLVAKIKEQALLLNLLLHKRLLSSHNATQEEIDTITDILKVKHFVIAPFFAQMDIFGIIFAGNESSGFSITEGDEELISILADHIGQAIKNARLFEEVYRSSQKLELTVQERTRQLSLALENVQKISKNKSDFISAVSHELRTPLTSIKGYASILMTGKIGAIPDRVKERLEKINKHSDNLVKLINDLLDISRIESGRADMKFSKHDIKTILDAVSDLLSPQIKDKNIQFSIKLAEGIPKVAMDSTHIERVLINLVGNAIKFTPEKGEITIEAKSDERNLTVFVKDTGVGVSEEDLGKLFDEFYRVDNAINQTVKGTGLGLTLSKKIITAHNGEMGVHSKLHQGTTFYFTIPLERNYV